MPTDKPRFSIVVSDELYEKINDFRFERRIKSQSKAVNELILIGLESLSGNKVTIGPTLSKTQIDTIEKYDSLDAHGKVIIDFILEKEYERCTASSSSLRVEESAVHYIAEESPALLNAAHSRIDIKVPEDADTSE